MVWAILGWTLLALAVAFLAAIMLPVEFAVALDTGARRRLRATVRLFGGLAPPISLPTGAPRLRDTRKPALKRNRTRKPKSTGRGPPLRMIRQLPRLVRDVLGRIRLHRLAVDLRLGFDDPATTGEVYGLLLACSGPLMARPDVDIVLIPQFGHSVFEGKADLALRATPVAFLAPAIAFAWRSFGPAR